MSLQDIKKNAEFVRQLELKGIAEAKLTGEPYQGTAKNMSSDEKMYLLAISKECTVPECIEAMKEKFNKIYTYHTYQKVLFHVICIAILDLYQIILQLILHILKIIIL